MSRARIGAALRDVGQRARDDALLRRGAGDDHGGRRFAGAAVSHEFCGDDGQLAAAHIDDQRLPECRECGPVGFVAALCSSACERARSRR